PFVHDDERAFRRCGTEPAHHGNRRRPPALGPRALHPYAGNRGRPPRRSRPAGLGHRAERGGGARPSADRGERAPWARDALARAAGFPEGIFGKPPTPTAQRGDFDLSSAQATMPANASGRLAAAPARSHALFGLGGNHMRGKLTRRRFLATTAASSALIAMPYVRGSHAAGKLAIVLWDHWVPGANNTSQALVEEWAAKEMVDVQIDYINNQGNKLLITAAAETQAKTGHDIMAFATWRAADHANQLVPVDDIMEPLIKQNGAVNQTVEYLGKVQGRWVAVPATIGTQIKGPCSRIDLMKQHAGIDVQALYPAGAPPKAESWTLDALLKAAEACHNAGLPFGIGLGSTSYSVDTAGTIFHSFGAELVDAKGNVTVKTDAVRQALEYYTKLAKFFPPDAPAWDDASNNKWSGGYDLPSFAN